VCTENLIHIDAGPNRLNVNGDGRAALLLPDLVRLAVQVKEPPSFASSRHQSIPLHPISKVDLSQSSKASAPLKELFFFGNFCKWRQGNLSSAPSLKKIGWLRIVQEVIARQSRSQALIEFEPPGYLSVHVEFFKSIIRCTRCGNIIDPMPVSIVQVSTPSFWSVLLSSRFWAALKSSSKTRIVCVARCVICAHNSRKRRWPQEP
jgi:hypothetical protein